MSLGKAAIRKSVPDIDTVFSSRWGRMRGETVKLLAILQKLPALGSFCQNLARDCINGHDTSRSRNTKIEVLNGWSGGRFSAMTNKFPYTFNNARYMLFVDGENLAIRYGCLLKKLNKPQSPEVECEKDIFVLLKGIDYQERRSIFPVRKYYYTALQGDQQRLGEIEEKLKGLEFEAPQVFKKDKQRGSKRVDIALATDMLLHAARKQMTQLFWSRETRIMCPS